MQTTAVADRLGAGISSWNWYRIGLIDGDDLLNLLIQNHIGVSSAFAYSWRRGTAPTSGQRRYRFGVEGDTMSRKVPKA